MVSSRGISVLCFIASLLLAIVVPWMTNQQFHYIIAPLVMLMYNSTLLFTLWFALLGGLALDALTLSPRLGFLALTYLVSCRLLYPYRLYFFKDSKITLPVMTFFFSLLASLLEFGMALFFAIPVQALRLWDLLLGPIYDVAFALVVFELSSFVWVQYRVYLRRRRCANDS